MGVRVDPSLRGDWLLAAGRRLALRAGWRLAALLMVTFVAVCLLLAIDVSEATFVAVAQPTLTCLLIGAFSWCVLTAWDLGWPAARLAAEVLATLIRSAVARQHGLRVVAWAGGPIRARRCRDGAWHLSRRGSAVPFAAVPSSAALSPRAYWLSLMVAVTALLLLGPILFITAFALPPAGRGTDTGPTVDEWLESRAFDLLDWREAASPEAPDRELSGALFSSLTVVRAARVAPAATQDLVASVADSARGTLEHTGFRLALVVLAAALTWTGGRDGYFGEPGRWRSRLKPNRTEASPMAAQLALLGLAESGIRPRAWPNDWLQVALGPEANGESDTWANLAGYLCELDQGRVADARAHLLQALPLLAQPPLPSTAELRAAVAFEAAYVVARFDGDAALARACLAHVPAPVASVAWWRSQAALALATGEAAEAVAAAEQGLAALAREPNPGPHEADWLREISVAAKAGSRPTRVAPATPAALTPLAPGPAGASAVAAAEPAPAPHWADRTSAAGFGDAAALAAERAGLNWDERLIQDVDVLYRAQWWLALIGYALLGLIVIGPLLLLPSAGGWRLFYTLPLDFLLTVVIGVTVHELGHAVVGTWAGYECRAILVGPAMLLRPGVGQPWRLSLTSGFWPGGACVARARHRDPAFRRATALMLGGPAASLLFGLGLLLAGRLVFAALAADRLDVMQEAPAGVRWLLTLLLGGGFGSLLIGLTALRPTSGGAPSDGAAVRTFLRGGEAARRNAALLALSADDLAGVRPRDWPADALAAAVGLADGSWLCMLGHRYHYFALADLGCWEAAEAALTRAWSVARGLPRLAPLVLAQFELELAFLAAFWRGDAATARRFFDQGRRRPPEPALLGRSQAALLAAEGDMAAAAACAARVLAKPAGGVQLGTQQLVREWLTQLAESAPVEASPRSAATPGDGVIDANEPAPRCGTGSPS